MKPGFVYSGAINLGIINEYNKWSPGSSQNPLDREYNENRIKSRTVSWGTQKLKIAGKDDDSIKAIVRE